MQHHNNLVLIISVMFLTTVGAMAGPLQDLQYQALTFNTAINRTVDPHPQNLKAVLIPKAFVTIEKNDDLPPAWANLLNFPNYPDYIPLFLHPFDEDSLKSVTRALATHGITATIIEVNQEWLLTESRSLLPTELTEKTTGSISPRLSMTNGLGKWGGTNIDRSSGMEHITKDKIINAEEAEFGYDVSKLIEKQLGSTKGQYFEILPDRMVVKVQIPILDPGSSNHSPHQILSLGMTFRDVHALAQKGLIHIKGFVPVDPRAGMALALANGYTDVVHYLQEIEAPLRGRGWADFYALTGFIHSSPHPQNSLSTYSTLLQPLNTLKILDLSDLIPTYDTLLQDREIQQILNKVQVARTGFQEAIGGGAKDMRLQISFFKGSHAPDFYSNDEITAIETTAADHMLRHLAQISGVTIAELSSISKVYSTDPTNVYTTIVINKENDIWVNLRKGIAKYREAFISETQEHNVAQTQIPDQPSAIPPQTGLNESISHHKQQLIDDQKQYIPFLRQILEGTELTLDQKKQLESDFKLNYAQMQDFRKDWFATFLLVTDAVSELSLEEVINSIHSKSSRSLVFSKSNSQSSEKWLKLVLKAIEAGAFGESFDVSRFFFRLIKDLERHPEVLTPDLGESLYFARLRLDSSPESRSDTHIALNRLFERIEYVPPRLYENLHQWFQIKGSPKYYEENIARLKLLETTKTCKERIRLKYSF